MNLTSFKQECDAILEDYVRLSLIENDLDRALSRELLEIAGLTPDDEHKRRGDMLQKPDGESRTRLERALDTASDQYLSSIRSPIAKRAIARTVGLSYSSVVDIFRDMPSHLLDSRVFVEVMDRIQIILAMNVTDMLFDSLDTVNRDELQPALIYLQDAVSLNPHTYALGQGYQNVHQMRSSSNYRNGFIKSLIGYATVKNGEAGARVKDDGDLEAALARVVGR